MKFYLVVLSFTKCPLVMLEAMKAKVPVLTKIANSLPMELEDSPTPQGKSGVFPMPLGLNDLNMFGLAHNNLWTSYPATWRKEHMCTTCRRSFSSISWS